MMEPLKEEEKTNQKSWFVGIILGVMFAIFPPIGIVLAIIFFIILAKGDKGSDGRGHRTPTWVIILKMYSGMVVFVAVCASVLLIGGVMTSFTKPGLLMMSAAFALGIFCILGWLVQTLVMDTLFRGHNVSYDQFRDTGGNIFDTMPWPFNSDSQMVQQGGLPEPEYTNPNFVPDPNWDYQCNNCGARVEHRYYACWNCGYNWGRKTWDYLCGACGVRVPEGHTGCWHCGNNGSPKGDSKKNDGTAPITTNPMRRKRKQ